MAPAGHTVQERRGLAGQWEEDPRGIPPDPTPQPWLQRDQREAGRKERRESGAENHSPSQRTSFWEEKHRNLP